MLDDAAVIGGRYAGMAASFQLVRARRSVLVILARHPAAPFAGLTRRKCVTGNSDVIFL